MPLFQETGTGRLPAKGGESEYLPVGSDLLFVDKKAWSVAGFKVKNGISWIDYSLMGPGFFVFRAGKKGGKHEKRFVDFGSGCQHVVIRGNIAESGNGRAGPGSG